MISPARDLRERDQCPSEAFAKSVLDINYHVLFIPITGTATLQVTAAPEVTCHLSKDHTEQSLWEPQTHREQEWETNACCSMEIWGLFFSLPDPQIDADITMSNLSVLFSRAGKKILAFKQNINN